MMTMDFGEPHFGAGEAALPALTLQQPFASLLMAAIKQHETRSWSAPSLVGKRIVIHAGKRFAEITPELHLCCATAFGAGYFQVLPRGACLGTVHISAMIETEVATPASDCDWHAGDWRPGRWAWKTEMPLLFERPLPASGRQGLWRWRNPDEPRGHSI